jgi:outer membrane protein assembly factor BamD (BamD/ComL family)
MKRLTLILGGAAVVASLTCGAAAAQRSTVAKGPDPSVIKDTEIEKDAAHNLEVARHYFKMRKAYFASFKRAEELVEGYPEFARLDEALYIAGMSALYLSEGKGKQRAPSQTPEDAEMYKPEKLRAAAQDYLSRLVRGYSESKFRKDAEEALGRLKQ